MFERLRTGMAGFSVVWFGQVVSLLGSGMTQFALTIWAWELTGEATALAMVAFFGFFPRIVFTPLAGALIDRWNRKLVMILSDLAAGLGTIAVFVLHSLGMLEIWHLYVIAAFAGAFGSFQFPAYSASISLMLPKKQFTRANTMLGMAYSISTVFAPIAAGALLALVGITGILLIDIVTFSFAILTLLFVAVPQPAAHHAAEAKQRRLLEDCVFGFKYIAANSSLTGLLLLYFSLNVLLSFSGGVLSPMILARSGNDQIALGTVMTLFGASGLAGGALLTLWGGPKRKMHALFLAILCTSLLGNTVLGIGRNVYVWGLGAFLSAILIPLANGSSQTLWQTKIPPQLQGRVFSARILIGQIGGAIALPIAGLMADRWFEPLMNGSSGLADLFARLVGRGPGAGMGLMFVVFGLLGTLTAIVGFAYRPIREIEQILPDYDETDATAEGESGN